MKIFYSWQSWSLAKYNRNFIEDALEEAVKHVSADENLNVEPVIDRDTQGEAGSVQIADTIFRKIDESQIFLCDASIVTPPNATHPSPNPNVMLELGYAARSLGWENIICVVNESYGKVVDLPFDLRPRRLLFYRLTDGDDKNAVKKGLVSDLEKSIKVIVAKRKRSKPSATKIDQLDELLQSGNRQIELDKFIQTEVNEFDQKIRSIEFINKRQAVTKEYPNDKKAMWLSGYKFYIDESKDLLLIMMRLVKYGKAEHKSLVSRAMRQLTAPNSVESSPQLPWCYAPSLLLMYAVAIAAVISDKWSFVSAILDDNLVDIPSSTSWKTRIRAFDAVIEYTINPYENDVHGYDMGEQLVTLLKPLFEIYSWDKEECEDALDKFEFFFALVSFQLPPGRPPSTVFAIQCARGWYIPKSRNRIYDFLQFGARQKDEWPPLKGGLFEGNVEKFISDLEKFQTWIDEYLNKGNFHADEPIKFLSAYEG